MGGKRRYDLTLFGATGFTGRLSAEYLARTVGGDREVRWAIAGRRGRALAQLKRRLEMIDPGCAEVGVIEANLADPASLLAMTRQTRVQISTVGPYADYGEPVIHACVEGGCDYVDITGEPHFVDRMIERYGEAAESAGLRFVPCCGFDSIPHDVGARWVVSLLPPGQPITMQNFVLFQGRMSGGTWHSMVRAMGDYFSIRRENADRRRRRGQGQEGTRQIGSLPARVHYAEPPGSWVAPLPSIDPLIIKRSARTLDEYGPNFQYGHYIEIGSFGRMLALGAGIGTMFGMAQLAPTRALLLRMRPQGQGPNEEERRRSRFRCTFVAKSGGRRVVAEVSGGDPGYDETSKMLAEAALCLSQDDLPERRGFLTPAVAMGQALQTRIEKAGIRFQLVERY